MPLRRKIIQVGNSKAVTIPSDWLEYYEKKLGRSIDTILMEVNQVITLAVEENKKAIE